MTRKPKRFSPNTDRTTNLNQQAEEGEKPQTDIREGLTEQKSTGSGREQIAKVSLNGAQISSILEIIQAVSIGGNGIRLSGYFADYGVSVYRTGS